MTDFGSNKQHIASPYNMSDTELKKFVVLIYDECGIALSEAKKSMLSARLSKRLRALGMTSFKDYYRFVTETLGQNDEMVNLVDVVTTNTTHFFRESNHFDYLTSQVLPRLACSDGAVRIWSAGCSTGEEPYTIAMVLAEYFEQHSGDFEILATDVSTKVLQKARQGIYTIEDTDKIPPLYKHKYLMRGKGAQAGNWRLVPELRRKIAFAKINFMSDDYGITEPFDIIFCRNVIIYFDRETKVRLVSRFYDHLVPGGYLFIGHSETLNGMHDHLRPVAPTVYRKPQTETKQTGRLAA